MIKFIQSTKQYLRKEYAKTLQVNKKENTPSLSKIAGRILVLFFVMIAIFTFVSRTAASFSVAQITVVNPQRESLNFLVSGSGTIQSSEEKYLNVIPGYRIDKVNVLAGEKVVKGDILFQYNKEELKKRYHVIEIENKKLEIQIKQEKLNETSATGTKTAATALSLEQAEANLKNAKLALKKVTKEYESSLVKTKEELLKEKKEEYSQAVKNYESAVLTNDKNLTIAKRAIEDAKTALSQTKATKEELQGYLLSYQNAVLSKESLAILNVRNILYEAYYGGSEAFNNHKDEVLNAERAVARASYDVESKEQEKRIILARYSKAMETALSELEVAKANYNAVKPESEEGLKLKELIATLKVTYDTACDNYSDKQVEYTEKIEVLNRILTDANQALSKVKHKDTKLEEYLTIYQRAIQGIGDQDLAERNLLDYLLGDNTKTLEKDIIAKALVVTRAEEDYETLKVENQRNLSELQTKIDHIKEIIQTMESGTYDYAQALEAKKQAVEAAKIAILTAKQMVDTNKVQYELDKENDVTTTETNAKNAQNTNLKIQSLQMDQEAKSDELASVEKLLAGSGKVKSPYNGTITAVGIEAGKTTTGEELIKIGVGDYIFKAEFEKDSANYVKAEDEIGITLAGEEKKIKAQVKTVSINTNNMAELTAVLPESNYLIGQNAKFEVRNTSDNFDCCIPIQSLRKDNIGYYVLVTKEQEGILGTELVAFRINVELKDKDNTMAAVDASLSSEEKVISDSNKYIEAGDKVRLK